MPHHFYVIEVQKMPSCMVHKHSRALFTRTFLTRTKGIIQNIRNFKIMAETFNVRWAFNVLNWKPSLDEILSASSYIQPEEKLRISRFVFQNDAKSSLIGRLMLRRFVQLSTSMPYNQFKFGRDARGKPYLLGAGDLSISFNVSHQGDYVVLAGNKEKNIGIDVMSIEPPANKNIPEFFRLMTRQFSPNEWSTIKSFETELEQIACFYRLWCLKESYVKNIGLGITIPLDQISFSIKTLKMKVGEIIADTVLYEKGVLKSDFVFEETLLDKKHAVAVSIQNKHNRDCTPASYTFLNFEELTKDVKALQDVDYNFGQQFMSKEMKTL